MGGKKKKKRETTSLRTSSSRRDSITVATKAAHQTTQQVSVGCMSGIFHFVSKYHTRRKFLTFGNKKQEKEVTPPPPAQTTTQKLENGPCTLHDQGSTTRLSLEVPRSPAIPAEIRRPSLDSSNSPRVVARLMGLEDIPTTPPTPPPAESAAAEKRRKLLGALEKCDEDLQVLKQIIEAVRATTNMSLATPATPVTHAPKKECKIEEEEEGDDDVVSEEPSPVSVLDYHTRSSTMLSSGCNKRTREGRMLQEKQHQQQEQHMQKQQIKQHATWKKPGEEDKASFFLSTRPYPTSLVVTNSPQSLYIPTLNEQRVSTSSTKSPEPQWSSAMNETVIEVCRNVEWGQRRENGSIGLLVEDVICRDLIDELIKELDGFHVSSTSCNPLPYEACKRKLCL